MSLSPPNGRPRPVMFSAATALFGLGRGGEGEQNGNNGQQEREEVSTGAEEEEEATAEAEHQQHQHSSALDFSALAMQLLQQAHSMFGQQHHQWEQENGRLSSLCSPTPMVCSSVSPHSNKPAPHSTAKPSSGARPSKSGGGRRSSAKSVISAAATAALLAPSPLGALPAIPGAIAVAASPAAQLFREDDWSWHRNPAAAIRSGGTNKQTPVWKYFVYNKTENLSRCIVGNCTYQLKGPHTSTLACHLKKHAAEYAEFQRLKGDYTRERAANGQQGGGTPMDGCLSSCSTPSSQSNSNAQQQILAHQTNGMLLLNGQQRQSPKEMGAAVASKSPSLLSPFRHNNNNNFGDSGTRGGSSSCSSSPGPMIPFGEPTGGAENGGEQHAGTNAINHGHIFLPHHPNGGIFGHQQQLHPLPFHHFMMAAALASANGRHANSNGAVLDPPLLQLPPNQPPPNHLELFLPHPPNGVLHQQKHMDVGQPQSRETSKSPNPSSAAGTGTNLLDILNLLSKRAEAAAAAEQRKLEEEEEEAEEEENRNKEDQEEEEMSGRRKAKRKRAREQEEEEEEEEGKRGRQQNSSLAHSVEHLLDSGSAKMAADDGSEEPMEREQKEPSQLEAMVLSLGTTFPRSALRQLVRNPFVAYCGLTLECVDEVLDGQFALLLERMHRELTKSATSGFALMADLCCACCWASSCECVPRTQLCALSIALPPDSKVNGLLLRVRPLDDEHTLQSLVDEAIAAFGLGVANFLLVRPSSLHHSSIPTVPAIFPDVLRQTMGEAFDHDADMQNLNVALWKQIDQLNGNDTLKRKFQSTTGKPIPSSPLSGGDKLELFMNAVIWTLGHKSWLSQEFGILCESEWTLLSEIVRLQNMFQTKICLAEGDEKISLEKAADEIQSIIGALRSDFVSLGEFAQRVASGLAKRSNIMAEAHPPLKPTLLSTTPCTPIALRELIPANVGWSEEEYEGMEKSMLLLANRRLLQFK